MKISFQWLNQFIDLNGHNPQVIADVLTIKTCEVERVYPIFNFAKQLVIGEIKEISPHPNAGKLKICKVVASTDTELIIVTGANNPAVHKKYPLALEGALLPDGLTIRDNTLRGVLSQGMLCSAEELGMQDFIFPHLVDNSGDLLELPPEAKVGDLIAELFPISDIIFDIDNKSLTHRPDLWGHVGFARELSAILNIPLKKLKSKPTRIRTVSLSEKERVKVQIKDDSAIAYSGVVIQNVDVCPSPIEIQAHLIAAGVRPINNIVDASNYVMLELGQPNHAFDREQIQGDITVCLSEGGEEIMTLDSEKRKLTKGIPLIKDKEKPIAIGGIIGGQSTEVRKQTKTIFIESATFHRAHIRKGVSGLSLRTEASQRFEKGLDPSITEVALNRFAEILSENSLGLEMGAIDTIIKEAVKKNKIETSFSFVLNRLGDITLTPEKIVLILNSLGMNCHSQEDKLRVDVPSFRSYYDIEIPEDIVEEVARVMGYEKIQEKPLFLSCEVAPYPNRIRQLEHKLRDLFSYSYHFTEVYNYSFCSEEDVLLDTRYAETPIEMKNPIQQDQKYLRVSPLPSLLKNIAKNHKQYSELSFYEIERIFLPNLQDPKKLPRERLFIAGVLTSSENEEKVLTFMGSILGDLLSRLGLPRREQKYEISQEKIFHPGRSGRIASTLNPSLKNLFRWGEIHPKIINELYNNIDKRIFYFESFLDNLLPCFLNQSTYEPPPKFPSSIFEMTILVDKYTPFQEIEAVIESRAKCSMFQNISTEKNRSQEVIEYLGSFSGEQIPSDKKAVSLRFTWTNYLKTIEHEELKVLQNNVIQELDKAGFPLK